MAWVEVLGGLVLLVLTGDALVKGAVNLALRLGIPALIVSLTIVAFGTSAPELLISVQSVLEGVPDLALGNVVGSNIANVLLVLGLPAVIAPLATSAIETRSSYLQMLAATGLFIVLALNGPFGWGKGLILLAGLATVLVLAVRGAKDTGVVEGADIDLGGWKIAGLLLAGLIGLPLGAHFLIEGASAIARGLGVSEAVIGLTLVAIGTSLPELATTVMAAIRKQSEVALGNVIGSNLFNLLGIIGVASLVGPIPVASSFLKVDLWVMAAAALALLPFVVLRWNITRIAGFALLAAYMLYLIQLV